MRTFWAAAFFSLWMMGPLPSAAQHVSGCVVDAEQNIPLPATHISTTGRGAVADSTGCYALSLPPGRYVLTARMLGYASQSRRVMLSADTSARVDFRLTPHAIPLQQLEVVADRIPRRVDTPALTALTPEATRALPGASEDVMRALQSVPGVLSTSDFSSQLVVRGSRPDENLITIDGVEIFNPHRLHGVVSVFNPELLSDAKLYAGGFPAHFGDRLAAVLAVETRSGTREDWLHGTINTSLSNANLVLEGQTGFWDGAWIVAGRRTYYDLILERVDLGLGSSKRMSFPNFADVQGKLTLRPSPAHELAAGLIAGRDALDMTMSGEKSGFISAADRMRMDDVSRNDVAYARWRWTPSENLRVTTTASAYRNRGQARQDGQLVPRDRLVGGTVVSSLDTTHVFDFDINRRFRFRKWSLQQTLAWTRGRHTLEAGLGADRIHTALTYDLDVDAIGQRYLDVLQHTQPLGLRLLPGATDRRTVYRRYSAFVQDEVSLADGRLALQPGVRLDRYGLVGTTHLSPRLRAQFTLIGNSTLHAAWGRYVQSPGLEKMLMSREQLGFSDETLLSDLRPERATHYLAGLKQHIADRYTLQVDAYWKTMRDLITPVWTPTNRLRARYTGEAPRTNPDGYAIKRDTTLRRTNRLTNSGRGRAYGVEVTLRRPRQDAADRLTGWITYAYARSTRSHVVGRATARRVHHPFAYDRRHTLKAVANLRLGARWTLGASFRYGTGFPHTTPTGHAAIITTGADGRAAILTHSETGAVRFRPTFGGPAHQYRGRFPAYHRLDLRLTRAIETSGIDGRLYVDVMNVYNRRNVLSYQYAAVTDPSEVQPVVYQQALYMLPLVPSLGFSVSF